MKEILELFHDDTKEIKPNNEDQEKDLEKKIAINTASKSYDKLYNIYITQYDNLSQDQKKKLNVLNSPENAALDFVEDNLPTMPPLESNEEVKLEPEETSSEREK